MGAKRRRGGGQVSVKSDRTLSQLGVVARLASGEQVVAVGTWYQLREQDRVVSLAFTLDGDELCVGYAAQQGERWQPVEMEPYSLRALGYWQRWLKRHGIAVRKVGCRRPWTA
ncbi:MAG: hypothetical protein N3C12_16045 [Candidatus Binatia bacterium]|nr:hypothetical protein [Candidatus Binatia bacterium]